MADDMHNLVLGPFRDIVSKGNKAIENGTKTNSQVMVQAAQSLVKNAERALNKIEPVCKRQLDEHRSHFIDALKENDDISSFREQLNDMIWDLDDYLEVNSFDAEIYSKLQTLLRTAALKLSDIVVRMKLEPLHAETTISPASDRPRTPSIILSPSPSSPMEAKAGPIQDWEEGRKQREDQHVPPEPLEDPWKGTAAESLTLKIDSLSTDDAIIRRRPQVSVGGQSHESDDLVSPLTPDHDTASPLFNQSPVSASRENIVSPIDDHPRNSFTLSPDNISTIPLGINSREPFPQIEPTPNLPPSQSNISVSSSPVSYECGLSPTESTTLPPVHTTPDTEGLIPVEYDDNLPPSTQQPHQNIHQQPTVISIETFPRAGNTILPPDYNPHQHRRQQSSPTLSSPNEPPETLPLLPFPLGTRITSVSFPAHYAGEWAIGWIDNTRGIFPMDSVHMEIPKDEVHVFKTGSNGNGKTRNSSGKGKRAVNMSAVARWRHVPTTMTTGLRKEREGSSGGGNFGFGGGGGEVLQWLKFDKGEVITNIYSPHPQHWCWAGYNAKGKYGIFPRAFMTPGTLLEEAPSNLLQLLHKEVGNKRTASTPSLENANSKPPGIVIPGVGNVFSRISSKGLGLRRLSGSNKDGNGGGGVNGNGNGNGQGGGNGYLDWGASASEEGPPDSPSGSYYTPGSAGSSSTRSPRPSLY